MYTNHSNYFSFLSCEHPYLGDYIKKLRQILIYLRKKKLFPLGLILIKVVGTDIS